ncbi:cyclohexa-1,5-dienecarbonyl-CoA hydratase [Ignavibacteria bacterium CHB1]|nr:MAG: cyclohexa-1,5-dienecarbonyl-CoA hydratase [Chlorobiota bacterium]MBV6398411.1 Cyclohexa-1,5-dienecarbonyl-CoA hydratase [Ignavibacteria bacterium]MCC6885997.1 enoyl-CoA hydratase/isomerase family protein [Ignavibacteriales bacterium]MCE7952753.1 cyclohexa-1,5-dienecarbonyl-CoA hydratase [Chlorobi bacterium CHB7]MDL1886863.1 cyclohexa-1,5-dienecarbonyl-CoA hydratase [Ignavibacteria bacterium CHB1]RIK50386.1 MAG: cyclohexa-1,5-dienecarbonyl-CoA hydratase [Ignavibacteriota bacterium]
MKKVKLNYSHKNSIATLILDDGKGNILDNVMMNEILECFAEFREKKNLKMIIIEGAGKHFSFGASVEEHTKALAGSMLKTFHSIFRTISEIKIPTLAKVSGQCLGGGMELALMCNLIFADKTAKFAQPEITLGVFPPPASLLLELKIGYAKAEEILLTGRTYNAEEALGLGFINKVFDDKEELNKGTLKWLTEYILPKSASSLRIAVSAMRFKFNHILSNFLPYLEEIYLEKLMETKDANEGINAFIEKRKPVWKNM